VNQARLWWHNHRYFPYERDLARREVESILGAPAKEFEGGLSVSLSSPTLEKLNALTYFKGIQHEGEIIVPHQARLEASANSNGQGRLPAVDAMPILKRQNTRYSAHGLHEYRGKFNPQVVRAIGNILNLEADDWLLDPFCGSGTTLLEAAHIGWNCVGLEINPLGVLIANAKVTAFKTAPEVLNGETEFLVSQLDGYSEQEIEWEKILPNAEYLAQWFTEPVLSQLAFIINRIERVKTTELRDVFRAVLSNLCRDVSLQDPGDLRIRRRKNPAEINSQVIHTFIESLHSKVNSVLRAREWLSPRKTFQAAFLSDCRTNEAAKELLSQHGGQRFAAAITSPPYATALPYVDTQRLSLCVLGLIRAADIRKLEKTLIGNREISDAEREGAEKLLKANAARLPSDVFDFCRALLRMAQHSEHGFRKRNVPALVFSYFWQMAEMFASLRTLIRPGGKYALLVGTNKTTLKDEEVLIDTPQLLASVAESRGWGVEEAIPFDTYQRFDIHRKNSIKREVLLVLRNDRPSLDSCR